MSGTQKQTKEVLALWVRLKRLVRCYVTSQVFVRAINNLLGGGGSRQPSASSSVIWLWQLMSTRKSCNTWSGTGDEIWELPYKFCFGESEVEIWCPPLEILSISGLKHSRAYIDVLYISQPLDYSPHGALVFFQTFCKTREGKQSSKLLLKFSSFCTKQT